jgi:hypothetical protein
LRLSVKILFLIYYDPLPALKGGFFTLGVSAVTPPTTGLLNNPAKLGFINLPPHVAGQPHPKGRGLPIITILSTPVIYRCPPNYGYREITGTVGYYTCNLHVRLDGWHREYKHVVFTLGKIYKLVMLY